METMAQPRHTPGPWRKDRQGQLYGANGKQVGVWNAGIAWVQRDDESEANADLVGQSPELLAALQGLLRAAQDVRIEGGQEALGTWVEALYAAKSIVKRAAP